MSPSVKRTKNPLPGSPETTAKMLHLSRDAFPDHDEAKMRDLVDRAEGATGAVVNGTAYGCGGLGCVFPTKDGNVLKISNSWGEREIVDALVRIGERKGAFSGFARVIHPPVSLQYGVVDGIWAYVRERVTPAARRYPGYDPYSRDDDWLRLLESLAELSNQAEMENVPEYDEALKFLERQFESELVSAERGHTFGGIAKTLRALFDDGILLYDMKLENIGERKDGTIVLFDAEPQVLRPRKANPVRGNATKRTTMKQPPMKKRAAEQSEHQTMAEQGKMRDEHLRAQEQPLAWSAWEIKHHSRQHNVRSWSIQALRDGGYLIDGPARRVRGGDGTPGGWLTPVVLTQKGEKLASTWSAAKSKALEAKWAKGKKAFEQSLKAAAHAKSIRAAMGDDALAFAQAEQAASPGAFWDEVVRVLDR